MSKNNKKFNFMEYEKSDKIIKLILWVVFLIILYLISVIIFNNSKSNNSNNKVVTNNTNIINNTITNNTNETINNENNDIFTIAKDNLLKQNYSFIYTYESLDNKINYKGDRNYNEYYYYKELNNQISKYYVKDDEYYIVNLDNMEITDKDELLETYFNIEYIFNLISSVNPTIDNNTYIFQKDNIYVKIILVDNNISNIDLQIDDTNYHLSFSNINLIDKLVY